MIRLGISVEGQTEDEFCKRILAPYFLKYEIWLKPTIVTTSRQKCGKKSKGGCINLDRIKNEISKILPTCDFVTTFYDLYGFKIDKEHTAQELENKIKSLFPNSKKLIPYIQQYEFETLLFSDPSYYKKYFDEASAQADIEKIISECGGIENINNSRDTSPSKRIIKFFEQYGEAYDKVFHGYSIVEDIELDIILEKCSRFRNWVDVLKKLNNSYT